jgi:hypothetical protein
MPSSSESNTVIPATVSVPNPVMVPEPVADPVALPTAEPLPLADPKRESPSLEKQIADLQTIVSNLSERCLYVDKLRKDLLALQTEVRELRSDLTTKQ